jgi:hypothetical protein
LSEIKRGRGLYREAQKIPKIPTSVASRAQASGDKLIVRVASSPTGPESCWAEGGEVCVWMETSGHWTLHWMSFNGSGGVVIPGGSVQVYHYGAVDAFSNAKDGFPFCALTEQLQSAPALHCLFIAMMEQHHSALVERRDQTGATLVLKLFLANSTSSLALARAMIMSYEGGVFHLLKLFEGSRNSPFMSHSDPGYLRYDSGRAVTVSTEGKVDGREVRWLQAPETRKDRVLKIVAVASDQVGATVTLEGGSSFINPVKFRSIYEGEGCLHILAVNQREHELIELLKYARDKLDAVDRQFANHKDASFMLLLNQCAWGTFFADMPVRLWGGRVLAFAAAFGLTQLFLELCGSEDSDLAIPEKSLKNSINQNSCLITGALPLHAAAACGRQEMYRILCECGADEYVTDFELLTPMQRALVLGNLAMVEFILKRRIQPKWQWGPVSNLSLSLNGIDVRWSFKPQTQDQQSSVRACTTHAWSLLPGLATTAWRSRLNTCPCQ